jgi:cellulose synthase/poly-beta-1,6-N-acetylglucosamine synthase-like glycosyltransferase
MSVALVIWAWLAATIQAIGAVLLIHGVRQIRRLREVQVPSSRTWPSVTVVIAARNEEHSIEPALQSVLQLDYPALKILVVNDRSTDNTGAILDRWACQDPRLHVVHVTELPPGWLGKNHALHQGAMTATSEWILFTDADVLFAPGALKKAIVYAENHALDLLAAFPEIRMPTLLLQIFALTFEILFFLYFQPWRARNPNSRSYVGVGAFNLVRRSSYWDVGGHAPIAMRPDDDVKLGQLFKLNGKRIDVVDGVGELSVPWYASLREVFLGLEKNLYAGVDYRLSIIAISSLGALLFYFAPFVLVFFTRGATQWGFAIASGILLALATAVATATRMRPWAGVGFPLGVLLFILIQWRTTALTFIRGGIQWRGTFYSLDQLRANRLT